jgi:membrane protein involved in colicin uptake
MTTATESLTYGRFTVTFAPEADDDGYSWALMNESDEVLEGYKTQKAAIKEAKAMAKDEEEDAMAMQEEEEAEAAEEAAQEAAEANDTFIRDFLDRLDTSNAVNRVKLANLARIVGAGI